MVSGSSESFLQACGKVSGSTERSLQACDMVSGSSESLLQAYGMVSGSSANFRESKSFSIILPNVHYIPYIFINRPLIQIP
jgi:hypothetical protein